MGKIIFDIITITLPIITFILLTANIIYSERVDENPTTSLGRQCVIMGIVAIVLAVVAIIRDCLGI